MRSSYITTAARGLLHGVSSASLTINARVAFRAYFIVHVPLTCICRWRKALLKQKRHGKVQDRKLDCKSGGSSASRCYMYYIYIAYTYCMYILLAARIYVHADCTSPTNSREMLDSPSPNFRVEIIHLASLVVIFNRWLTGPRMSMANSTTGTHTSSLILTRKTIRRWVSDVSGGNVVPWPILSEFPLHCMYTFGADVFMWWSPVRISERYTKKTFLLIPSSHSVSEYWHM